MEAKSSSFLFLSRDRFQIPYFQRPYVWSEDNWRKLINNIIDNNYDCFIGSVIIQRVKEDLFSIIDGQQRITTICILLKACQRIINDEDSYDARIKYMLFHSTAPGVPPNISQNNLSLIVNHSIEKDFGAIMMGELDTEEDSEQPYEYDNKKSNVINCYRYFCGKEYDENGNLINIISVENAKKIVDFLLKDRTDENNDGCIIKITLRANDNAQRIFDTINAEGVRLTCVDIIKNNLFSVYTDLLRKEGKNTELAFEIYDLHWKKIFEKPQDKFWDNNISSFFSYFGTILKIYDRTQYKEDQLDKPFKQYFDEKITSVKDMELFIEKVLNYALIYRQFIVYDERNLSWKDYKKLLSFVLNKTGESTLIPYVLKNYYENCKRANLSSIDDSSEIEINDENRLKQNLSIIMKVAIRFYVCSKNKIKNFNKKIFEVIDSNIDDFQKNLSADKKHGNDADLTDEAFKKNLQDIKDNEKGKLLLFLLELYKRDADSKSPDKELTYSYSLEHIIAQKYKEHWDVDRHPAYIVDEKKGSFQRIDAQASPDLAEKIRTSAIYNIGNMLLLTGPQNSSQGSKYITFKVESKNDINTGKKDDRWASYETCNDLSITHEVVETYKKNLINRPQDELWDERDVYDRYVNLSDQLVKIF